MRYTPEDKPITEDERLLYIPHLVRRYTQLVIDADFDDDPKLKHYQSMLKYYKYLLAEGKTYEPTF
jgi:hypothetical protein